VQRLPRRGVASTAEAAVLDGLDVRAAEDLADVFDHL
jgi:hypothetical protein